MTPRFFLPLALLANSPGGAAAPTAAPVPAISGPYAPRETCARLPGTAAFRAALNRAVKSRNAAAMAALASPAITLDFGGGSGRAELRRRLQGAEGGKLWTELGRILALGCAVQGRNLVMPSIFAHDFGDIDPFDVLVVTGASVPLRAGPSAGATPVRLLSWTLVEPLSADDFERPFRQVRLHGGGPIGYVETASLRSPLDYRIVVARRGRAWQIDAFVAGD